MTKQLETLGKMGASGLIENQSARRLVGCDRAGAAGLEVGAARGVTRGGATPAPAPMPLLPTPCTILADPEGQK